MKLFGFNITKGKKQPEPEHTIYAAIQDLSTIWDFSDDRKTIYEDLDRMAESDAYVARAVDYLVSDVIPMKSLWEPVLEITECENETLKKRIIEIINQSGVEPQLRNIGHSYFRYGNTHAEYILTEGNQFSRIKQIPQTWSMFRNVNPHGTLKNGDPKAKKINVCAYDQRNDAGGFLAGYYPYQILHWRMPPFDKIGDGTPFLKCLRHDWIKDNFTEDAMRRARIIRAYMKLVHQIPGPLNITPENAKQLVANYIKSQRKEEIPYLSNSKLHKSIVKKPTDVETDYYLVINEKVEGKITALDPSNPQLQNINDVEYFQNRKFAGLIVPKARLANERDVNAKATLIEQDSSYGKTVVGFQIDILIPIVEMIKRTLIIEGWSEDKIEFRLSLPSPFVKSEKERAQIDSMEATAADKYIKNHAISRSTIRKEYWDMDDKASAEEEEKIMAEKEIYPAPMKMGLAASQIPTDVQILEKLEQLKKEVSGDGEYKNRLYLKR